MRESIRFLLNGAPVSVAGGEAWLMLSEFLRRSRGLAGTKVVCAEGDCGSCAALVGRPEAGRVVYRSIASCITQLIQVDASHVVTVEGLRDSEELNAFQESMAREHGAQCGFCTPGFVVAAQGMVESGVSVDLEQARRGLTGNLCRCTGYDAILRAVVGTDPAELTRVNERYADADVMPALERWAVESVLVQHGERTLHKPVTLEEAAEILKAAPSASDHAHAAKLSVSSSPTTTVWSGGTDLGVVCNKRGAVPDRLLYLGGVASLDEVTETSDEAGRSWLVLGAGVTLHRFQQEMAERVPEFAEFLEWFGSPPIRHAGTVGGNLCTASPIGDTLPAMHVLGAQIDVASSGNSRSVPIAEFHTGYRQTSLEPGELVQAIRVPLPRSDERLRLMKVSRRKDMDISTVSAAFFFALRAGVMKDVRIAFGGVAATVERATSIEGMLEGQTPCREVFERAAHAAERLYSPMTDVRGSADYRKALCRNLILKLWHEIDSGGVKHEGVSL
ncbi:MAG: FAD binding domain-containing protein [Planctomycetota bacterium]